MYYTFRNYIIRYSRKFTCDFLYVLTRQTRPSKMVSTLAMLLVHKKSTAYMGQNMLRHDYSLDGWIFNLLAKVEYNLIIR